MSSQVSTSPFHSDDMGLVTYLRLMGHEPNDVDYINGTCLWQFEASAELDRACTKFRNNEATVSPKEYNKAYKRTRTEFYNARDRHQRSQRQ